MAKPPELPDYQLAPQATPVDTYLQPIERSIAKPSAPPGMPQVKGITQVGQNSVGSYQGYNQAQQLAQSLTKFNPAMTNALKAGGLALATHIMDKNHQQAVAAAQQAEALLDSQTQLSAEERAAATRRLAGRDPQAGGWMHILNPYREWGWQRGMAYSAGQKLKVELPQIAAQLTAADYMAPDQGMGRMIELRNQKLEEINQQYGVDENTPSYQNYVLRPFNSSSDKLRSQVMSDRVKWMDDNQPRILGNNLGQHLQTSLSTGTVNVEMPNGDVVTLTSNDPGFKGAVAAEAQRLVAETASQAGLPGQRTKWMRDAYKDLISRSEFAPGTEGRRILDNLTSTVPLLGGDGKQKKDRYGNPIWLTMGQAYRSEEANVSARLWAQRQRQLKADQLDAGAAVTAAIQNAAPGDRVRAATAALETWRQQQIQLGNPPDDATMAVLRRDLVDVLRSEEQLGDFAGDPEAMTQWEQDITAREAKGRENLNSYEVERQKLQDAVNALPRPQRAAEFRAGMTRLQQIFGDQLAVTSNFPKADDNIKAWVTEQVNIGWKFKTDFNLAARNRATRLLTDKAYALVGQALLEAAEAQDTPLSEARQRQIASSVLDKFARDNEVEMQRMMQGGNYRAPQPMSTTEAEQVIQARDVEDARTAPRDDGRVAQDTTKFPVYTLETLAEAPPSRARNYDQYAVLDVKDLVTVVEGLIDGDGLPRPLKKFLGQNKAIRNPMQFIDAQMKIYADYPWPFSEADLEALRSRYRASTATYESSVATTRLQERGLNSLAALNDWAYMA